MALLQHCWYCSLNVAASVLAVYTAVAYVIAFFIEIWLIWEVQGSVPYVEYVLACGFFLTFILSTILVRGISERKLNHLIVWMAGMIAMMLPEGGLVIFMVTNYWKIHSVNGLTEVTFWACRLIVNISSIVCVQSLYSFWKEENEVITSLRDLNKASTNKTKMRRDSVSSDRVNILNSYINHGFSSLVEFEKTPPTIRRSDSMLSLNSTRLNGSIVQSPIIQPPVSSEFDASKFRKDWPAMPPTLMSPSPVSNSRMMRSRSLGDLSAIAAVPPAALISVPVHHGSLDRRIRPFARSRSSSFSMSPPTAYFNAPPPPPAVLPPPGYLLDTYGNLVRDPRLVVPFYRLSKNSLAESDDQNYKDVAL